MQTNQRAPLQARRLLPKAPRNEASNWLRYQILTKLEFKEGHLAAFVMLLRLEYFVIKKKDWPDMLKSIIR